MAGAVVHDVGQGLLLSAAATAAAIWDPFSSSVFRRECGEEVESRLEGKTVFPKACVAPSGDPMVASGVGCCTDDASSLVRAPLPFLEVLALYSIPEEACDELPLVPAQCDLPTGDSTILEVEFSSAVLEGGADPAPK